MCETKGRPSVVIYQPSHTLYRTVYGPFPSWKAAREWAESFFEPSFTGYVVKPMEAPKKTRRT